MPTSLRMGQPIKHPAGYEIKITRPLDFMAVTDHPSTRALSRLANDPNSDISKLPIAEKLKVRSKEDIMNDLSMAARFITENKPITELTDPRSGRQRLEAGCQHCGQVLSAGKVHDLRGLRVELRRRDNRNMHRNIIFKDSKKVPDVTFHLD